MSTQKALCNLLYGAFAFIQQHKQYIIKLITMHVRNLWSDVHELNGQPCSDAHGLNGKSWSNEHGLNGKPCSDAHGLHGPSCVLCAALSIGRLDTHRDGEIEGSYMQLKRICMRLIATLSLFV